MESEREGINLYTKPSGTGCVECLATDGWWLHLRRCAECGHIGCCDSSPSQHASKHSATTGHPIINSFEHGEDWFYDYRTREFFDGPKLLNHGRIPSVSLCRVLKAGCPQDGKPCSTSEEVSALNFITHPPDSPMVG